MDKLGGQDGVRGVVWCPGPVIGNAILAAKDVTAGTLLIRQWSTRVVVLGKLGD